jgi:hypothetical protein
MSLSTCRSKTAHSPCKSPTPKFFGLVRCHVSRLPFLYFKSSVSGYIKRDSGSTLPVGARRRALLQLPGAPLQPRLNTLAPLRWAIFLCLLRLGLGFGLD